MKLYHVTEKKNLNKIFRNGLLPRNQLPGLSHHDETDARRVHFLCDNPYNMASYCVGNACISIRDPESIDFTKYAVVEIIGLKKAQLSFGIDSTNFPIEEHEELKIAWKSKLNSSYIVRAIDFPEYSESDEQLFEREAMVKFLNLKEGVIPDSLLRKPDDLIKKEMAYYKEVITELGPKRFIPFYSKALWYRKKLTDLLTP